jgi:hypothetical protein
MDPRITAVIDNLSSLIRHHAGLTASEQYHPGADADRSDDIIKAHGEWVKELRQIRERFENLVTGIIE